MTPQAPYYRIGVISDTHSVVAPQVFDLFAGVQLILHAGDVGNDDVLTALETIAPLRAVSGNVDGVPTAQRPLYQQIETPAGRIAVTHGHLRAAPSGDRQLLAYHFRDFRPSIIIFGHSHIPTLDEQEGVVLFNPGSAGRGRFGQGPSVGLITVVHEGVPPRFEHIYFDE